VIEGLRYEPSYIDHATHDSLVAAADREPWLFSVDHRVQVYGYRYHHPTRSVFPIGELPTWAADLAQRLHTDGLFPSVPDQLVVNDYRPGAGLFTHVDQAAFGDTVASVSLGSTCVMQFSRPGSGRLEEIFLEPRSALVLSGAARWEWQHGIPARTTDVWQERDWPRSRRVSLTFRAILSYVRGTSEP
jgi:alkylated DNA repair dioxygenase AlkB